MKERRLQSGITLTEMTLVIAAVAVLGSLVVPAVNSLLKSFESKGQTSAMINSALASARATAMQNQRYAGVRFQKAYNPSHPDDLSKWDQYMIHIIHDYQATGISNGFRAAAGAKPIKLPGSFEVMDLLLGHIGDPNDTNPNYVTGGTNLSNNSRDLADTTTFSVVFSPAGRLVTRTVQVRNRDGSANPTTPNQSGDDIFNSWANITDHETGRFIQDGGSGGFAPGIQPERSREFFIIYNKARFYGLPAGQRYNEYLGELDEYYISPHSGRIIETD